jgi:hypothetical protein
VGMIEIEHLEAATSDLSRQPERGWHGLAHGTAEPLHNETPFCGRNRHCREECSMTQDAPGSC